MGNFYNGGLWGNSLSVVVFELNFAPEFRLKPSNDRGELELDRAKSKNNISENSFALGHEMHHKKKNCSCLFAYKSFLLKKEHKLKDGIFRTNADYFFKHNVQRP